MMIKAIVPYFGAKRQVASQITSHFGEHVSYWEPFCGSASILLAKEPSTHETVNDLNGDLTNLMRVVQDDELSLQLFDRLNRTACNEQIHIEAAHKINRKPLISAGAPDLERAYLYFVASWLGRNGCVGTDKHTQGHCRRFSSGGGSSARRFTHAVESIPEWWHRLRTVSVLTTDGIELIEQVADEDGTLIYCDPPYFEKGARYLVDFEEMHHDSLAKALQRFTNARVIVSYYDHKRIKDLYQGWNIVELEATKFLTNSGASDKKAVRAPEILVINEPQHLWSLKRGEDGLVIRSRKTRSDKGDDSTGSAASQQQEASPDLFAQADYVGSSHQSAKAKGKSAKSKRPIQVDRHPADLPNPEHPKREKKTRKVRSESKADD